MSTNYKRPVGLERFDLTQFSGGTERGMMLQITDRNSEPGMQSCPGFIQVTQAEAIHLHNALLDWIDRRLVPES